MAHFDKFTGQSPAGWDKATGAQTVRPGGDARIGLWGGGPAGEELAVSAADPTVCTVHELPRPTAPNWRVFAITALREGDTEIRAVLPGTTNAWATMQVHVAHAKAGGIRLVFFPGERTSHGAVLGAIYVIGGKGERFEAAGGPRTGFKRATDGGHTGEPTPAGRYTLGPKQHVVTSSWPMSTIPFGAALRLNKGEVEWENDAQPGIWHVATGPSGAVTRAFMAFMQRSGQSVSLKDAVEAVRDIFVDRPTGTLLFTVWKQNDFGRWGWNLRNARGAGTAYFIHTTPDDEAETEARRAFFLANSHGCIHIRPIDRDKMISLGYLKQGVEFDVRSYDEKGPP